MALMRQIAGVHAGVPATVGSPLMAMVGNPMFAACAGVGAAVLCGPGDDDHDSALPLLLLVGAGLVGFWLWSKRTVPVASPPVLVTPLPPTGPGGPAPIVMPQTVENPNLTYLQQQYASQPKQLAVINSTDAETLRRWVLIYGIWTVGTDPYTFDLYGNPTTNRNGSIGMWWEQFSQQQGF